ncbi:hypothetical protein [Macellibacteroides fermentans]|uniref:hypothetical protein n=1 Tax=Macellibacteroides fermentans TaxID=879969 RepID=UPI00406BEB9B
MYELRTIKEALAEIRLKDPNTAVTEYFLRNLVKTGQIPSKRAGIKYLVDLRAINAYFNTFP